jgi:xylan 1,4-beta-xylosidase
MGVMAPAAQQQQQVSIRVDTAARKGPMHPFWAWFGHDEPNYTYTANGKKLLSALQDLSPSRVRARAQSAHVR